MIEQKLRGVMSSVLGVAAGTITAETSAGQLEQWDSIRHLELILAIEEVYGVHFETEKIPGLRSAGEIQEALRALM